MSVCTTQGQNQPSFFAADVGAVAATTWGVVQSLRGSAAGRIGNASKLENVDHSVVSGGSDHTGDGGAFGVLVGTVD